MKQLEEMSKNGSGGVFGGIIKTEVKLSKSKNIFGGSYVELPEKIKNKQACVNIKNDDNECFYWSLKAYKHYDEINSKSKNEVRHYKKNFLMVQLNYLNIFHILLKHKQLVCGKKLMILKLMSLF